MVAADHRIQPRCDLRLDVHHDVAHGRSLLLHREHARPGAVDFADRHGRLHDDVLPRLARFRLVGRVHGGVRRRALRDGFERHGQHVYRDYRGGGSGFGHRLCERRRDCVLADQRVDYYAGYDGSGARAWVHRVAWAGGGRIVGYVYRARRLDHVRCLAADLGHAGVFHRVWRAAESNRVRAQYACDRREPGSVTVGWYQCGTHAHLDLP